MGVDVLNQAQERQLVEQISGPQRYTIEQVLNTPHIRRTRAPNDAEYPVSLREKKFGQVRAVLTRDSRDDRALSHVTRGPRLCRTNAPTPVAPRPAGASGPPQQHRANQNWRRRTE